MLLPLEYSMTLWWVATPQWGTEPDVDALAQPAEVVDEIDMIDPIDTLDKTAPDEPPPARPHAPVSMRSVVTGYTWSAEPHWAQVRGPLYERFVADQRHDAQRHRSDRVRFVPAAERRLDVGALWDRAGSVCAPMHSAR